MSDPLKRQRLVPAMPLTEAVELACRRNGRSVNDVFRANYVSAVQLECVLAEKPDAGDHVPRFEPHWEILFAAQEYDPHDDGGRYRGYGFDLDHADHFRVFHDGETMTDAEFQPGDE